MIMHLTQAQKEQACTLGWGDALLLISRSCKCSIMDAERIYKHQIWSMLEKAA